jgi:hypothetical protein
MSFILFKMATSTPFPHFSPQSYYKPYLHFVNTFQHFLGNFWTISVLQIQSEVFRIPAGDTGLPESHSCWEDRDFVL